MAPIIEALGKKFPELEIEKVNVDQDSQKASEYNVMSIPTFVFLKEGKEVGREIGSVAKEHLEKYLE
jgi:thioredoxin 1